MSNVRVQAEAVASTLTATLHRDEAVLEISNAQDEILLECYGVEDEEDAAARLRQHLGALAGAVPLEVS